MSPSGLAKPVVMQPLPRPTKVTPVPPRPCPIDPVDPRPLRPVAAPPGARWMIPRFGRVGRADSTASRRSTLGRAMDDEGAEARTSHAAGRVVGVGIGALTVATGRTATETAPGLGAAAPADGSTPGGLILTTWITRSGSNGFAVSGPGRSMNRGDSGI